MGRDGWEGVDHAGLHFFRKVSALRRTLDGRRVSGAPTKLLRAAGLRMTIGVAASHGFLVGSQRGIAGKHAANGGRVQQASGDGNQASCISAPATHITPQQLIVRIARNGSPR